MVLKLPHPRSPAICVSTPYTVFCAVANSLKALANANLPRVLVALWGTESCKIKHSRVTHDTALGIAGRYYVRAGSFPRGAY